MEYKKVNKEAVDKLVEKVSDNGSAVVNRNDLEEIFPELKESEDETIRKEIIALFKGQIPFSSEENNKKFIAWLEKQKEIDKKEDINNFNVLPGLYKCVHRMFDGTPDGKLLFEVDNIYRCLSKHDRAEFEVSYGHSIYLEDPVVCKHFIPFEKQCSQIPANSAKTCKDEQKPAEEIEPTPIFRIGDVLKRKVEDYTFKVDRIQGGYYHCDRNHGAFFPIEEQDNWELVEQNHAWSEEDENMLKMVIKSCEQYGNEYAYYWLKSLKDRILPQPKQEWSEEDKSIALGVEQLCNCASLLNIAPDKIDKIRTWLKSLRPQNRWKPSEEQMEALESATENCAYSEYQDCLRQLIEQLKKLKE